MRIGSCRSASSLLLAAAGLFFALPVHADGIHDDMYYGSEQEAIAACNSYTPAAGSIDPTHRNQACQSSSVGTRHTGDPGLALGWQHGGTNMNYIWEPNGSYCSYGSCGGEAHFLIVEIGCAAGEELNAETGECEAPECEDGRPSVHGSVALNVEGESCVEGCIVRDAPGSVSVTTLSDGMTWGDFEETGDVCTGADGNVQPMPSDNCYSDINGDTVCYPMDDNPSQCGSFNGHYMCLSNMSANTCEFGGDSAVCTGEAMPDLMGTETITDSMEASIDPDGSGPEEPTNVSQHDIGHNTSSGTTTGGGDDITARENDTNPDGTSCDPDTENCGMTIDVGVGEAGRDGGEGIDTSEFDEAQIAANEAMNAAQEDGAWSTPSLSPPIQPAQSCSSFDLDTGAMGAGIYSMDLCPFISLVQTALAWFFSLLTAVAIFNEWRTA